MSVRSERLESDFNALSNLCWMSEVVKVQILEATGNPAEFYRIKLSNCKGVESIFGNTPKYRIEHIFTIGDFPRNYPDPGAIPAAKMETPLFHPNVYSHGGFCFNGSDRTSIDEPLDIFVKRIINMIQYGNLRFGSPANSSAMSWANANKHLFPLRSSMIKTQSNTQSTHIINWD
jgi:hypothetical protein